MQNILSAYAIPEGQNFTSLKASSLIVVKTQLEGLANSYPVGSAERGQIERAIAIVQDTVLQRVDGDFYNGVLHETISKYPVPAGKSLLDLDTPSLVSLRGDLARSLAGLDPLSVAFSDVSRISTEISDEISNRGDQVRPQTPQDIAMENTVGVAARAFMADLAARGINTADIRAHISTLSIGDQAMFAALDQSANMVRTAKVAGQQLSSNQNTMIEYNLAVVNQLQAVKNGEPINSNPMAAEMVNLVSQKGITAKPALTIIEMRQRLTPMDSIEIKQANELFKVAADARQSGELSAAVDQAFQVAQDKLSSAKNVYDFNKAQIAFIAAEAMAETDSNDRTSDTGQQAQVTQLSSVENTAPQFVVPTDASEIAQQKATLLDFDQLNELNLKRGVLQTARDTFVKEVMERYAFKSVSDLNSRKAELSEVDQNRLTTLVAAYRAGLVLDAKGVRNSDNHLLNYNTVMANYDKYIGLTAGAGLGITSSASIEMKMAAGSEYGGASTQQVSTPLTSGPNLTVVQSGNVETSAPQVQSPAPQAQPAAQVSNAIYNPDMSPESMRSAQKTLGFQANTSFNSSRMLANAANEGDSIVRLVDQKVINQSRAPITMVEAALVTLNMQIDYMNGKFAGNNSAADTGYAQGIMAKMVEAKDKVQSRYDNLVESGKAEDLLTKVKTDHKVMDIKVIPQSVGPDALVGMKNALNAGLTEIRTGTPAHKAVTDVIAKIEARQAEISQQNDAQALKAKQYSDAALQVKEAQTQQEIQARNSAFAKSGDVNVLPISEKQKQSVETLIAKMQNFRAMSQADINQLKDLQMALFDKNNYKADGFKGMSPADLNIYAKLEEAVEAAKKNVLFVSGSDPGSSVADAQGRNPNAAKVNVQSGVTDKKGHLYGSQASLTSSRATNPDVLSMLDGLGGNHSSYEMIAEYKPVITLRPQIDEVQKYLNDRGVPVTRDMIVSSNIVTTASTSSLEKLGNDFPAAQAMNTLIQQAVKDGKLNIASLPDGVTQRLVVAIQAQVNGYVPSTIQNAFNSAFDVNVERSRNGGRRFGSGSDGDPNSGPSGGSGNGSGSGPGGGGVKP